jgi:putative phosphoesterase
VRDEAPVLIGVISDTHGLLEPRVGELFEGVDLILHAGDVGGRDILVRLSEVAPVCAVCGNVDADDPECSSLPGSLLLTAGGVHVYMTHVFTPSREGVVGDDHPHGAGVVIFGHSHQQYMADHDGVLYFNPASAGRKRFRNPRSVGIIEVGGSPDVTARFLSLE